MTVLRKYTLVWISAEQTFGAFFRYSCTQETPYDKRILLCVSIGGATPKFLGGPNVWPTQSITSFSTQDKVSNESQTISSDYYVNLMVLSLWLPDAGKNSIGWYLKSTKGRYCYVYLFFKLILESTTNKQAYTPIIGWVKCIVTHSTKFWVGPWPTRQRPHAFPSIPFPSLTSPSLRSRPPFWG